MRPKIPLKYLILPSLLLSAYFIFRLIDQSQILNNFPLDYTNDISSYMSMLHFLQQYGYHSFVPNWFNGFVLFDVYAPGWFFFVYPLYFILGDMLLTVYLSMIIMIVLFLIMIYYLGKIEKWSKWYILAFFILFVGSPFFIGDYIRQMRLPQMFGWIALLPLIIISLYYRTRRIDFKFLFTIPFFALTIISHSAETILFSVIALGLLLTRKKLLEVLIIIFSFILGILISLPWLYTFIIKSPHLLISSMKFSNWLFDFVGGFKFINISSIFLGIALIVIFLLYAYSNRIHFRTSLFFIPIIAFALLYIFRLTAFLPIYKNLYPDPVVMFLYFFFLYFLFNIKYENLKKFYKMLIKYGLVLLPVIFILISVYHTPLFIKPNAKELFELSIAEDISEKYLILGHFTPRLYPAAFMSYATIYHNASTASGWAQLHMTPEHWDNLDVAQQEFHRKDCYGLRYALAKVDVKEVLSYGPENCGILAGCGLDFVVQKGDLCLYKAY